MTRPAVIFIIDDDSDDQEFLKEALTEIEPSFQYFTALNGQEALKKLQTNTIPVPSLIFLDLNMPRINGRKFLSILKSDSKLNLIPVIIYSTSSAQKDFDDMKQLGALDYLVKQSDFSILHEKLHKILSSILTNW